MGLRVWLRGACIGMSMVLASCGGGGGGGGSSLSLTSDKASFQIVGLAGQALANQSITFTLHGGTETYFGSASVDQPGNFSVDFQPTGATTALVTLVPISTFSGSASGIVTLRLCRDAACAQVALTRTVPYSASVFSLSAISLSIAGHEGAISPAQTLTITPPDATRQLTFETQLSNPAWLTLVRDSDSTLSVHASGSGLSANTYQGNITVRAFQNSNQVGSVTIPVAFTVGIGTVAPPAQNIDWTLTSTAPNTQGGFPVQFNGTQSPAWSAVSDQPWLELSGAAGVGAASVGYAVNPALLGGIPNWSARSANVTIKADGLSDVTFQIAINKKLPEVYTVSPRAVALGSAPTLKISGKGLNQAVASDAFQVEGLSGVTGVVVSDTEALLTVPAISSAGAYRVVVPNASNLASRTARLSAMAVPTLSHAAVGSIGTKRSSLFDETRTAVFAVNIDQNTVVGYTWTGTNWQVTNAAVPSIGDLALSPDRQTLYVGSGATTLLALNPDTLQVQASHALPGDIGHAVSLAVNFASGAGWSVTNDMKLWFASTAGHSTPAYFDLRGSSFHTHSGPGIWNNLSLMHAPLLFAPSDGSRMLAVSNGISPAQPSALYIPSTGEVSAPGFLPVDLQDVKFSESGSRMLANGGTLYDGMSFQVLGSLEPSLTGVPISVALSANGTRIFRLLTESVNSLRANRVEVFDATQLGSGSSNFVKLGEIPVTEQAFACGPQFQFVCDIGPRQLNVSPFGNTLFWVGSTNLVVIPVPQTLSGSSALQARLRKAAR
jgi:hypothetical protein